LCGGATPTPAPPGPQPNPTPAPPVPPVPTPVPKPPGAGGLKACHKYVNGLKPNPTTQNKVTPLHIAAIWMRATGDMKGGRNGKVSGCDIDPKTCQEVCVAAVTQALGECQSYANPVNSTVGGCKVSRLQVQ
jgi:hypothetical protein